MLLDSVLSNRKPQNHSSLTKEKYILSGIQVWKSGMESWLGIRVPPSPGVLFLLTQDRHPGVTSTKKQVEEKEREGHEVVHVPFLVTSHWLELGCADYFWLGGK